MRTRIALIAHDARKDALVAWAGRHLEQLRGCDLVATGTTGGRLVEAYPGLVVERVKSGPLGGDQQIGARIAEGKLDWLIFFIDPLSPLPHDVDVKALTRLATLYNLPTASNEATADLIVQTAEGPGHPAAARPSVA